MQYTGSGNTMDDASKREKPSIFEARETRMSEDEKSTARRSEVRNSCGIMKNIYGGRTY